MARGPKLFSRLGHHMHPACLSESDLLAQCELRTQRRSGPGGQHGNKVETAVVVTHRLTNIVGQASERRSRAQNRAVAIRRLRLNLAIGFRSVIDSLPDVWTDRTTNRRLSISGRHPDFPAILSIALDVLDRHGYELKNASNDLELLHRNF